MPGGRSAFIDKFQVHIATTLDKDKAEEFRKHCKKTGQSAAKVIRNLIQIYMEQVNRVDDSRNE